jgi:predicted ferric reductase
MKTPEKKYAVIRHYTRDGLENFGYDRWVRKHVWWLVISFIILFTAGISTSYYAPKNNILQGIIIIVLSLLSCVYIFQAYRYGKRFYQKVKDLPEPIDLDQVK